MQELVRKILTSKVYGAAIETPLDHSEHLSTLLDNQVYLKREDLQPVFSFKLRGAFNKIANLTDQEKGCGIVAASAGNHAQGVAYSCRQLDLEATIVMPATTPQIKVDAVRSFGARVILYGDNYSEAADHCRGFVDEHGGTYIHPFDDDYVIAGQGTIGDELLRQTSGELDYLFVPVGGGGLIAGVAAFLKALSPDTRIIGVEPEDSDAMTRSLAAGELVELNSVGIFADGVAVREVGGQTFALCQQFVDDMVLVSTDEICSSVKSIYQTTRSIVEPAGALGVAGMKKYIRKHGISGKKIAAITSGANMNFERLRYVAERTRSGENREAILAVTIPEEAGALRRFCTEAIADRNITEFNYRLSSRDEAHIFVGIETREAESSASVIEQLAHHGYKCADLTNNELAKTHVRYMVGGRSDAVSNEKILRFWFPERTGALAKFLSSMGEHWNISLFHYRNQGGEYGRVLIGLETPEEDSDQFIHFLDSLGYNYFEESENPAYQLFL